jgi:hypothetical protein
MPIRPNNKNAEILALNALTFLGNSEAGLGPFLASADMQPQQLAARVEEPGVQIAILDFLLADEALLLAFCQGESLQPKDIHLAKYRLEGSPDLG